MKKLHSQPKPGHVRVPTTVDSPNPFNRKRLPEANDKHGLIIDNKYRLGPKIGEGGISNVYLAIEIESGREVVLKLRDKNKDKEKPKEENPKRITQEIQALSRVRHENIVSMIDAGIFEGDSYIVMEHMEGMDLFEFQERIRSIDSSTAAYITLEVCKALKALHEKGILHRDIKPANVFLLRNGRVKILDFDIASFGEDDRVFPGHPKGTPGYMSPEVISRKPADARSDIFSLGVAMYEMLTKTVPFLRPTTIETLIATEINSPLPPSAVSEEHPVPGEMDGIVMKALEKRPEDRFQGIKEMHKAIEQVYGESGFMAPRLSASVQAAMRQRSFEMMEMRHEVETAELSSTTI